MELQDLIAIGISVAALLFSAFTWWSGQREAHRNRGREYLEDFLRPMRSVLNLNRDTHRSLIADTKLANLEFAPDYVQRELHQNLSPDDPRRIIWRAEISRLMSENKKAVELMDRHIGRVESEGLRGCLEEFKKHALKWQAMWDAVLNPDPQLAAGYKGTDRLNTEPFPEGLDELLAGEITRVERIVGIKRR
ncbi:MAG TPA: hypothetical protein VIP46_19245 [Pyrinomonadaceae bacterium]